MTLYKITLTISGDKFQSSLVRLPSNNLKIIDTWGANTPITHKGKTLQNRVYGYGGLLLMYKRCWATTEEHREQYESDFIDFIKENECSFRQYGAEEMEMYYEILHDEKEKCEVSLFSSSLLRQLAAVSIPLSLPVSVYSLETPQFQEYLEEVNNAWK